MVYVKRDDDNQIVGIFVENIESDLEEVAEDDVELQAFMAQCAFDPEKNFLKSDLELIRVIEDVIQILMEKDIIHITDFPIAVIQKLVDRKKIRKNFDELSDILEKDD